VCQKLGVQAPKDDILLSLWTKLYNKRKIKEDTLALVKKLHNKYPLGLISNTIEQHAQINRESGLFEEFDVVILSNEVGLEKPQKEIFELTSERMRIPLSELLFIDDIMRWVDAAKESGMQAVQFETAAQLERDLAKLQVV